MTSICGTDARCDRHERALHGYPCHACEEEYWRRYPKARAVIHRWADSVRPIPGRSELAAARKRDQEDRAAYDGPHTPEAVPAVDPRPRLASLERRVHRGVRWSHYWLPSKTAARAAANAHLQEHL